MPTDQGTDTDEATDAETSEETPDTDTDTHNPPQPVDPATHGNADGDDASTDSDDSDRPDSDGTEDSGETSTATAGTNTNTDNADQQDSDQDNTNTAPAPPVDPNAETEGDSGIDQSGGGTAPDNSATDPDEGGDNAGHEDADSVAPPPPVDQNNTAGSEQNESDGSENEPLTNGVDSTDTDGENSVAGPGPANSPGSVIINGTETEDQVLTATLNDADGLPDGVDIRYQWQRNIGADSAFENIENATSKTYTLGDGDVGQTLRVLVNYTDANNTPESLTSEATLAVTNINDEPTGSVSIEGTAEEDQILTANVDNVADADGLGAFSYQWQCSNGSGGFENIENATSETYTLGDADVNREVRVEVRYTDGNSTDETLTSEATAAVRNINDSPSGSVSIDGTAEEDQILTANVDNVADEDGLGAFSYQWQSNTGANGGFENIDNATGETYTLGDADVGREVRVQVSYTDGNNTAETLTSAPTTAVTNINDEPTGSVSIDGAAREDETLTANTDNIADADGLPTDATGYRYQWQSNTGANGAFEPIAGATSQSYTLGDADVGREVRVEVRYTDGRGRAESVNSEATTAVSNINDNPTGSVTIDGTAAEDETLTANTDTLADDDGLGTLNYQWQRSDGSGDFENIANATGETYTLGDADVGRNIRVVVNYTDANNSPESLTSEATLTVTNVNDNPTGSVTINGTAREDQTLKAETTALQDADGLPADAAGYRYQWQSNTGANGAFENIDNATSPTYTLGDADVGRNIRVVVNYTDGRGTDESSTSDATTTVTNINDDPSGSVSIDGTAEEDQILTANVDNVADEDGLGAFSYQWQSNTGANGGFENIENATSKTYTLGDEDVGREVRVQVSYTDGNSTDETLTSEATTAVTNINDDPTGSVSIEGTAEEDQILTANVDNVADEDGLGAFSYQWQSNTGANGGFENIENATSETYTLGDADVGREVRVQVRYTDGNNTDETLTSAPTTVVTNINDNPSGLVIIDGTVREDQTLTANSDNLADADGLGALSYQWQRSNDSGDFENIENATGETYTLGDDDVGREVQVMVSYTDDGGMDESLTSTPTAAVENVNDEPTGSVTITGTVEEDQTLTANTTALQDADGLPIAADAFTYQWQSNTGANDGFENIENATSKTYTLGDADVGREVRVQVSYTDGNSTDETLTSEATTAVTNINDDPTGSVSIEGTAEEDQILTANVDNVADEDGLGAFSYQWQRNTGANGGFENIENASSETYTLGDADVGREVRVQASYTDGNSTDETLTSAATTAVTNVNDAPTGTVTIDGQATENATLTANIGTLDDADGLGTLNYQWQRNTGANDTFENIAGETGNTYTLGDADVSREVRVEVSYTDDRGMDETLTSVATAAVGEDILNGTAGNDSDLQGGAGRQTINGLGGDDVLAGGADNDSLRGGGGDDTLTGGAGDDVFRFAASAGSDRITDFGTGDDRLLFEGGLFANLAAVQAAATESGDNLEIALSNTETLTLVGASLDNLTASTVTTLDAKGTDTSNSAPTGGVRIDGTVRQGQQLSADRTAIQDADGLPDNAEGYRYQWQRTEADGTFADIGDATEQTYTVAMADVDQRLQVVVRYTDNNGADETLTAATVSAAASNANDPFIEAANIVKGTADDDFISRADGDPDNRRLNGLGGDDILESGIRADILDGGDGGDTAYYFSDSTGIEINLETGTGKGGHAEGDVLINIEDIWGGSGNDRLTGNNAENQLLASSGNDTLDGGAGNDGLFGSFGDDTLDGGDGNDSLDGSFDDDTLDGGEGNDTLTGGPGNDLFRFEPGDGSDTITDFGTGNNRLEFREGLFADLAAVQAAATQTDDGNLEIKLSDTETLTLEGVTLAALTADTVTTLDAEGNDTTTPPADANSASDAPAFELDGLSIDEEAIKRLAASEGRTLPPPEPRTAQSASEKLALADPLEPPPALALFDADLEGYSGL